MDTFANWSDTSFAEPKPFDPDADRTFLERAKTFVTGTHGVGEAFDAARSQAELVAGAHNLRDMRSNIYDDIISQVREASGVNLESPLDNGWPQQQQIAQLRRDREAAGFNISTSVEDAAAGFFAQREADFMQQLRDLKQQQPDKMLGIDVDTPISERIAQRFGAANEGLAKASADPQLGGLPQFAAETLGSMVGSRGDPNFWYSWALPGGGAGKAAWSRIGSAALTQGLGMAAMTALQQPATQALRAQAGLENNALEEIASAGLGGALIGGGAHAVLSEALPALRRVLAGNAKPADFEAAAAAGVHVDEPTRQAIAQEAEAAKAHAETLKAPDTVPEGTAQTAFAEGLTHAEDPNAPPPLVDRPVPPGTTDALARKVVGEAENPGAALDALRAEPNAVESALASDDPELRDMGRVASLGDEAFGLVKSGEVDPLHGAIVAGSSDDPAMQAELMSLLKRIEPFDVEDARQIVANHLAAGAAPEAATARVGAKRAPPPRTLSLLEFMAWKGLAETPELRQIFDGNPAVPFFGRLFRRDGLTIDDAIQAAKEHGYLFDPADVSRGERTLTPNHLYDLLEREAAGQKVWAAGETPEDRAFTQAQRAETERQISAYRKQIRQAVRAPEGEKLDQAILDDAAARLHSGEHTDPLAAWDAAAVDHERALSSIIERFDAHEAEPHDAFPGFDLPEVQADAGRASRAGEIPPPESRAGPQPEGIAAGSGESVGAHGAANRVAASPTGNERIASNAEPFGPVISASPQTFGDAVEELRRRGTGEIVGALHRPELGDISVPWEVPGDPSHGLKGLIARGRADVIPLLPDIIANGRLELGRTRARIFTDDHAAVVRLDYRADTSQPATEKRWLLTAFENDRPSGKSAPSPAKGETVNSSPQPAPENIGQTPDPFKDAANPGDMANQVPVARPDGTSKPVATDLIRYYHGTAFSDASDFSGKTWVTPDLNYARAHIGENGNVLYTEFTKEEAIKRGLYDDVNDIPQHGPIDDGAQVLRPYADGKQSASFVPGDMANQVPVTRPDGTVAFLSRADLGRAAERERWMGDVISACKD